jgi:hypothetical protein
MGPHQFPSLLQLPLFWLSAQLTLQTSIMAPTKIGINGFGRIGRMVSGAAHNLYCKTCFRTLGTLLDRVAVVAVRGCWGLQ